MSYVSDIDIPAQLRILIKDLGYEKLYPPQEAAIKHGLLQGKNLLVATPTASGKTLIAMMAAVRAVLEKNAKVVYLTPLRALASEKYDDFKHLEKLTKDDRSNLKVMISTGDYDSTSEYLAKGDVIVLTNEKMDSLMRHGAKWVNDVGLFVADEVHLLGDKGRGPTLEMMLTKILAQKSDAQLLALSATVNNSDDIAQWLNCSLIDMNWRPTELIEGVYDYGEVRFNNEETVAIQHTGRGAAVDLAVDSIVNGGQALIFAETRRRAVSLALKTTDVVSRLLTEEEKARCEKAAREIIEEGDDTDLTRNLAATMKNGAAFHHAGLNPTSRKIVEASFRDGVIKVLTATPTLAAGVNLPARRVVISSIRRYDAEDGANPYISVLDYKQMCGRAGRPKYDTYGEAIIAAAGDAGAIFERYIRGVPEPIESQLIHDRAMRVHLLSTIAAMPGMKPDDVNRMFAKTLLARQEDSYTLTAKIDFGLKNLARAGMIMNEGENLVATKFGRRVSLLYIDPNTAVKFKQGIMAASSDNHTLGFLHLLTDCDDFYPQLQARNRDVEEIRNLIDDHREELLFEIDESECSRSLLALHAWIRETGENHILEHAGVEPGDIYRMVETGNWLLYSMYEIARLVGKKELLRELNVLRQRVQYGIKEELIPLVSLEGIGRVRARALYKAGFKDIKSIVSAPVEKIASVPKIGSALAKKIQEQIGS